jgi:hypothetical protein
MEENGFVKINEQDSIIETASFLCLDTANEHTYTNHFFNTLPFHLLAVSPDSLYKRENQRFLIQSPAKPFEEHARLPVGFDWLFVFLLVFFALTTFLRVRLFRTTSSFYNSLLNQRYINRNYRNDNQDVTIFFFPFILAVWIIFSLILYLFVCNKVNDKLNIFLPWSFLLVGGFFIVRFLLLRLIGVLFNLRDIFSEFIHLLIMSNFTFAILSFPVVFINCYYPYLIFFQLIILIYIIVFIMRMLRGWILCKSNLRLYEYFLYFCTIEILPLAVFFKFVISSL